jgi:hypothetical protein
MHCKIKYALKQNVQGAFLSAILLYAHALSFVIFFIYRAWNVPYVLHYKKGLGEGGTLSTGTGSIIFRTILLDSTVPVRV